MSELRTGYISAYDEKRHMARVIFPDKGNLVSGWLPVSVRNSLKNHDEHHLDINEHVACIFNDNGIEEGIIISALYDDKNQPPESDSNTRKVLFEDGSSVSYDRKNKRLTVNCVNELVINAKSIIINCEGECRLETPDKIYARYHDDDIERV